MSRWFTIVESQFILANISVPSTKFHHILSNLPLRVINQLSDAIVISLDYDKLKEALISLFTRSKPELFDSLINQNKIMCDKPSVYLRELRRIAAQLGVDDEFIKLKFLKALPDNIRPLLITYKDGTSLDELARVAETLLAYGSSSAPGKSAKVHLIEDADVSKSMDPLNLRDDRGPSSGNASFDDRYFKSTLPVGVRAFNEGQRPQVCRYHLYYGTKAKSCKKWCLLSYTSTNVLPDSRSSSPAPYSRESGNFRGSP